MEDTADSKIRMSTRQGKGLINEANASDDTPDGRKSRNGDHKNDLYNQTERKPKPEKTSLAFPCQNGRTMELLQDEPATGDHDRDERAGVCCIKKKRMEFNLDETISLCENDAIDAEIPSCPTEENRVGNPSIPLSEKQESIDENDIGEADSQAAGGADINFAASESSSEVKSEFIHGARNQLSNLVPNSDHSTEKKVFLQSHLGDKGKALFDAGADKSLLKGKTHCQESAESCNSAMVVKKRCCFEQQPLVSSKKAKLIHNQPLSSGLNRQDSSFMSWISIVMKGLSRPTVDVVSPLSVALSSPHDGPEEGVGTQMLELSTRHTGFKNFFQSIYLPSQNNPEMGISVTVKETRLKSPPTGRLNEMWTTGDDPAPCHNEIDNEGKQLLLLNKEINDGASVIMAGPSSVPPGVDGHVAVSEQETEACSDEDKVSVGKDA